MKHKLTHNKRSEFLSEYSLADRWNISIKKLQADRQKGTGCPYVKFGRSVRYRLDDVIAFEDSCRRTATWGAER